jgi:hypothetical protein
MTRIGQLIGKIIGVTFISIASVFAFISAILSEIARWIMILSDEDK